MSKIDLLSKKNIYFIGIGGIGMSAIARMFLLQNKKVSGSDLSRSEVTEELEKLGADIKIGEAKDFLPDDIDLVIYTVAVPDSHAELRVAREKGIPTLSYPETLGLISESKFTIAVAGTHGKTTTTAMVAQILIDAGLEPTVIVGSLLKGYKSNFIAGKGRYFVAEACEYKRSFLNLRPDIAVITNIDADHLDYYKDLEGVQKGFGEFLDNVKAGGSVVTDAKDPKISSVTSGRQTKIISYKDLDQEFDLKIPGEHNISNAKAALAVALELGVSRSQAVESLNNFSGTWRRFDYLGVTEKGTEVYDDYAHHPTEIKVTLAGAKEKFKNKKIIVAFQPHLYSRTKEHFEEFADSLKLADEVLILPIYAAREPNDGSVTSEMLNGNLVKRGLNSTYFPDFESATKYLKDRLDKGDIFFSMGAGDINTLAGMLLS